MNHPRALPASIAALLAVASISNLWAEPAKRKRTPTPTPAVAAVRPTALATAAPAPASTPIPATPTRAAVASAPAGPAKADVEAAKALYGKMCQKCHGAEGQGVQRMYDLVGAKLSHIGSKQAQGKSDAEIKKAMLDGFGKMEVVEDLTPQQADKILAFVRTLSEAKH